MEAKLEPARPEPPPPRVAVITMSLKEAQILYHLDCINCRVYSKEEIASVVNALTMALDCIAGINS